MIQDFIVGSLICNICSTQMMALREDGGWVYKHFAYSLNPCVNDNKAFFLDGRIEEISTCIHVTEVSDYAPRAFDATLGDDFFKGGMHQTKAAQAAFSSKPKNLEK